MCAPTGDVIRKGEFFEGKLRVAGALGKSHISDKSKINWFGKTVRPLVDLGLVKKAHVGREGITQLISSMISARRLGEPQDLTLIRGLHTDT